MNNNKDQIEEISGDDQEPLDEDQEAKQSDNADEIVDQRMDKLFGMNREESS